VNYTIIGYRPDGSNSCRGCVMDRWGSEFNMEHTTDRDTAIQHIAELAYANIDTETDEWEINLLFDGVPCESCDPLASEMFAGAAPIAKAKHDAYVGKQAAARAADEQARYERQKEQDLVTLNRLKAQYETTNQGAV
jgi:hypothetical protein